MAEAAKNQANPDDQTNRQAIADLVRSRLTDLQERLGRLETDARGRVSRALATGNAKLRDLDRTLARVSRDDWTVPAVRKQLDELRARAEVARANALKRVAEMPGTAVQALAAGTRAPVQSLTNGLAAIARRLEARPDGGAREKPKAANGK